MAGRILVLDDEENYAEMLQELLREHGYRVDMATRPERALDQLEDIPYDQYLITMPVMDGVDFLKKACEFYPNLPVILVSGLMNTPNWSRSRTREHLVMENYSIRRSSSSRWPNLSPMTAAELEQQVKRLAGPHVRLRPAIRTSRSIFMRARMSKRFLHQFWNASKDRQYVFLKEPVGGDGALAVRDLSVWMGNQDLPVKNFALKELLGLKPHRVAHMLSQGDVSRVAMVRISSDKELSLAQRSCEEADWPGESSHVLVFILESAMAVEEFRALTADCCAVVPALALRPSDLAAYVRRFVRLACDRTGKTGCREFSDEVVLAILSYDWPGNYREVQQLMTDAVLASTGEALAAEFICTATGYDPSAQAAPADRLGRFLQTYQAALIASEVQAAGVDIAEWVRDYHLEGRRPMRRS